jgi:hypothetical protein
MVQIAGMVHYNTLQCLQAVFCHKAPFQVFYISTEILYTHTTSKILPNHQPRNILRERPLGDPSATARASKRSAIQPSSRVPDPEYPGGSCAVEITAQARSPHVMLLRVVQELLILDRKRAGHIDKLAVIRLVLFRLHSKFHGVLAPSRSIRAGCTRTSRFSTSAPECQPPIVAANTNLRPPAPKPTFAGASTAGGS